LKLEQVEIVKICWS